MKKQLYFYITVGIAAFLLWFGFRILANIRPNVVVNEPLQQLMDGNKRYVEGRMINFEKTSNKVRKSLSYTQKPYAIILSCSDSRVPPEIIFDQGLGEIFVIRVAGNVINREVLGSIEYAAEHLGSSLIMVLGHERCGAVTAAVNFHGKLLGNINFIIRAIIPAVKKAKQESDIKDSENLVENAVNKNIKLVAANLTRQSSIIKGLVYNGKVKIVIAKYDLDSGKVVVKVTT